MAKETRQKILAAAKKLGYRPSLIPRIMLTHRSDLVAIVVGGMYNPFYSTILEQFLVSLQEAGKQALLVHANSGHTLEPIVPKLRKLTASTQSLAPWRSFRRVRLIIWRN